jgi:archaellum component FlaC
MSNNKSRSNKSKNFNNTQNTDELIDNDLKDDYMDLIKAQNKKIQGLFSEIEKKDKLLSQYQIQLKAFEEVKIENKFLKSKISALTEDFNSKTKSMKEFYEKEIEKNLNEIKEKEQINAELLDDMQNIKQISDENKKKLELIQKENLSNIEKMNKSINSERDYESKAKELVNIIESQDIELNKFSEVVANLQNIIDQTKKNNDKLSKENENLKKENNEHENIMINMNSAIEDLKIQLKNNSEKMKKTEDKKENINKNYQSSVIKINELEKEIKSLKVQNNELNKNIESEKAKNTMYPKAIFDILSYFKTVMNSGYFWASTYIKPHSEFESFEDLIKDNGFILEPQELMTNIENNFPFLKNDLNNLTKVIGDIYQEFVNLIKNLYKDINEEFLRLDKIISTQKNGNSELLSKINNIENNSSRLKEEFKKTKSDNEVNEKSLNDIKNENSIIKLENKNIKNKLQIFEQEINDIYQNLIKIMKSNIDILNLNQSFSNNFNLDKISESENDSNNKLKIIKENLFKLMELSINSISELSNQNGIIQDYNRLKEECKIMNKELLQFKKEYSNLLENYNQEKENMINLIQAEKEKEINILKKESFDKINNLNKIIKKKEEEIEKLSNDNNLLYQQYALSQNNFEKYKLSRKKDDLNIQEKIDEMKKNIDIKNKEIKKFKNDNEIILNKSKMTQENLIKKSKENEILHKQINSLKKQKI